MPFFNPIIRQHLIETLGEACQRCGWSERNPISGKVPVEIEHVDGDWQNIAPENLTMTIEVARPFTLTERLVRRVFLA